MNKVKIETTGDWKHVDRPCIATNNCTSNSWTTQNIIIRPNFYDLWELGIKLKVKDNEKE